MVRAAGVPDSDTKPVASLSWEQVLAWRLDRQHLSKRASKSAMLDIVSNICGLHAQLHSSAQLSLWARIDGLDTDVIDYALWEDRSLVKLWAMRGTLHFLPAEEYPLWQAMLGEYEHYRKGSWLRHFGFQDEAELDNVIATVGEVLREGPRDRESLAAAVADELGDQDLTERLRDSWGATLKPAAFEGTLCYAQNDGQKVQFIHPEMWLGDYESMDPDTATREVTRRYLATYGPATREQYARWAGLQPAEAGRRIDALGNDVSVVELDESRMWLLSNDVPDVEAATLPGTVRLLPRFDPYVIGAPRDEPAICPAEYVERVYQPSGWIAAVILVDGQMRGVWEYDQSGNGVEISIESFGSVTDTVRNGVIEEAERLAEFLGRPLSLDWNER